MSEMATNTERAAEVLADWADSYGGLTAVDIDYGGDMAGAGEALADAGLLMPDLPEPSGWQDGSFTVWLLNEDVAVKVNQKGAIIIEHMDVGWFALPTEDASRFADMIKSATTHAEQEQDDV